MGYDGQTSKILDTCRILEETHGHSFAISIWFDKNGLQWIKCIYVKSDDPDYAPEHDHLVLERPLGKTDFGDFLENTIDKFCDDCLEGLERKSTVLGYF